jgi:hypothetical protein
MPRHQENTGRTRQTGEAAPMFAGTVYLLTTADHFRLRGISCFHRPRKYTSSFCLRGISWEILNFSLFFFKQIQSDPP